MKMDVLPLFIFLFLINLNGFSQYQTDTTSVEKGQISEQFHGSYEPNAGFRLATTKMGTVNFRIFSYIRYLNQSGLDSTFVNYQGDTSKIDRRDDIQLNKVNIQFNGWLLDPNLKYLFYVWTNNTAQGQTSQVVVAGNLQYTINTYITIGAGINSLPGVRSTEGNFPFWFSVDNRITIEEFFRPSYTTGIWVRGKLIDNVSYYIMLGNNLSQLGVDAGQLDAKVNTVSGVIAWYPTTGEYGVRDAYGDLENHEKVSTKIALHYTFSEENSQGQPNTEAFENTTIRISDGTPIFKPFAFGDSIQILNANYNMTSLDAGVKYKGFTLEGAYYYRIVNNFKGNGIEQLAFNTLLDNGFQILTSYMVLPATIQAYASYGLVNGEYGDPNDIRFGLNYYPYKNHVVRCNAELQLLKNAPVGGLSLPYSVGANGTVFNLNFEVNF